MIFQSSKFGFDISTWQDDPNTPGTVDFQKMGANGASFVIMRASVGNQYDVDFPTYKTNSRNVLPRGVYHYYWNNIDPRYQAQTCIAAIGGEVIEGRVWLDLETTGAGAFTGSAHWRTFIETIQAAGYRVGIYTGFYWWKANAVDKGADLNYFAQFPLWQAWYTTDPAIVQIAQGWGKMMLWQDTSSYPGASAGVESPTIDHNFWNDVYDFDAEWGTVTPPQNGELSMWKVITAQLNVRSGNGTAYPAFTTLVLNDIIEGVKDTVSGWIHISKKNGAVLDGWCSGNALYVEPYMPPASPNTVAIEFNLAAGIPYKFTVNGAVKAEGTA